MRIAGALLFLVAFTVACAGGADGYAIGW